MPILEINCPVTRITEAPFMHFFGYYDKCPWNSNGRYLLSMRVKFMDRPPAPDDIGEVGVIDIRNNNRWKPLYQTTAWNWQQGSMLQWLSQSLSKEHSSETILFNSRTDNNFCALIINDQGELLRTISCPIYSVASDGTTALSLNFSRLNHTRPGYGYCGISEQWHSCNAPKEDGIFLVNLESGNSKLIISLSQILEFSSKEEMRETKHWFNHLLFNPSGKRFIFLHRWRSVDGQLRTRLFTSDIHGKDIRLLSQEYLVSHFDWKDDTNILSWMRHNGKDRYYVFSDSSYNSYDIEVVGDGLLDCDGHCSFSPNRQWILTDTYPHRKDQKRTLLLYHIETNTRINIGRFFSSPDIWGEIRCDLHPRWSRNGNQICIDSIHERNRQIYLVDVSKIT